MNQRKVPELKNRPVQYLNGLEFAVDLIEVECDQ